MKTQTNHTSKINRKKSVNEDNKFTSNHKLKEVLLSREETKQYLSITYPTLRKWTKDGVLKCYQLGGRVYYKLHEILDALVRVE